MGHVIYLLFVLAFLLVYSNVFTLGYQVFLTKKQIFLDQDLQCFFAFALSFSTIVLSFIIPKYATGNYWVSFSIFMAVFIYHFYYCLKNKAESKSAFLRMKAFVINNKYLFALFFASIAILVIPAIHFPWYFGYGVDWVQHVGIIDTMMIGNVSTFYPAIAIHGFFSILNLLGFHYPETFQVGVAFILNLAIFPFYFLVKRMLSPQAVKFSLILWMIIPYHYFFYGEFISNAASSFFHLTFFLLIVQIFEHCGRKEYNKMNQLTLIAATILTTAIYTHQVLLYPYFYVYLLLTILYFISQKDFSNLKKLFLSYFKILALTLLLMIPFFKALISGAEAVLELHSAFKTEYQFSDFLSMIHNNIGFILFTMAVLGLLLYVFSKSSKTQSDKLSTIILFSGIAGSILAINIYFDGNPFWSRRSFYLFEIFAVISIAHLFSLIYKLKPYKIGKIAVYFLLGILLLAKVESYTRVQPIWAEGVQSSIEWSKQYKPFLEDKAIHLVFDDPLGANQVFQKVYAYQVKLPSSIINVQNYNTIIEKNEYIVLADNTFYTIIQLGDDIYFNYKVNIIKSFDVMSFNDLVRTKPKRSYTPDRILHKYFFVSQIDQQSISAEGKGLLFSQNRDIGQKFLSTTDYLNKICISLSKSEVNSDLIYLKLFDDSGEKLIKEINISKNIADKVPVNEYKEFCIPVKQNLIAGNYYMFYISTDTPESYYAVLNAGKNAYAYGAAYYNNGQIKDNLLFKTTTLKLFSL